MAVAEVSASRGMASRSIAGLAGGLGLALSGGAVWFLIETVFGRFETLRPFLGVVSIAIGGLAGWGAMLGTGRRRGIATQTVAVMATLPVLVMTQALVVRLIFVRELEAMGYSGATFRLPLTQWWEYVSWGLFSTSPPAILFWGMAIGYAIAVPRRYKYEEVDYR